MLTSVTYEKYKKNKSVYDNKATPTYTSIFMCPSAKNFGQISLGISTPINNISIQPANVSTLKVSYLINFNKNEIFYLQNPELDPIFPMSSVKFNHDQKIKVEYNLNNVFNLV